MDNNNAYKFLINWISFNDEAEKGNFFAWYDLYKIL